MHMHMHTQYPHPPPTRLFSQALGNVLWAHAQLGLRDGVVALLPAIAAALQRGELISGDSQVCGDEGGRCAVVVGI